MTLFTLRIFLTQKYIRTCNRNMSVFTSKFDATTGKNEWILMDDAFDYSQQIARSAYADMLHDTDRNTKFYDALKVAIKKVHNLGKKAIVLDIGTGTGILSMMAARCGADTVFACEFFGPMSQCAEKIIRLNDYQHKIKVIHKGSTQLTVGENGDMPCRANILVTEIFDTELIGEGAVKTFTHAQQELLEKDAIVIPSGGRVYASVFNSDLVNRFNKLTDLFSNDDVTVKIPNLIKDCSGSASVHDVQLSELLTSNLKLITSPEIVLEFDWTGRTPIKKTETKYQKLKAKASGTAHGVFMWWDLIMDCENKIILTCAPKWFDEKNYSWRDHWMQAVYYFPKNVQINKNQEFTLVTNHDEFSLWFDLTIDENLKSNYEVPVCDCGLHLTSRMRVGMINDKSRQHKFIQTLESVVTERSVSLNLSECSFLGHYLALSSTKKVYSYESNRIFQNVLQDVAKYNGIYEKLKIMASIEDIKEAVKNNDELINLLVSEPYFSCSVLPWHNLQFWYMKDQLYDILAENIRTVPCSAEFYIMAVQFEDLWKIRAPVKKVEGFDLQPFDNIIQEAITMTDDVIDAQPLWEYPCVALSQPHKFMKLNFVDRIPDTNYICSDKFEFEETGICNGLVLWIDWILDEERSIRITTGPLEEVTIGKKVIWDMYSKQGVYFVKAKTKVSSNNYLSYSIKFHVKEGSFEYSFKIL